MKEVIFFSNNKNKIFEISALFLNSPFEILNLNDFDKIDSPNETGKTFQENAKIKSLYGLKKFNKICFADDSGICIEALKNGPGINSKKFLEKEKNPLILLNQIILRAKNKKNFRSYFRTSICLSLNNKKSIFFNGVIYGTISKRIKGRYGFGYDPIFIPTGHKKTFAEMSTIEKNCVSHRAIAINKLKNYLLKSI